MAFASFGANVVSPKGYGPYAFRLHGQVYHRSGSLHPPEGVRPTYSQLYIIDGAEAVQTRLQHDNKKCRRDVMIILSTVMERVNPYAAAYKHMHVVEQECIQQAAENGTDPPEVMMYFKRGPDQRRYNNPKDDEVAAIFVSTDGAPPASRDIAVHPKDAAPHNIAYMSSNIDPMVYPILFPNGDPGWQAYMQHNDEHATQKRCRVTCLQYYAYRVAVLYVQVALIQYFMGVPFSNSMLLMHM